MYAHILVPLDHPNTDNTILAHVKKLARLAGARITLVHVADGLFARHQERFEDSEEIVADRAYLEKRRAELAGEGFTVTAILAFGEPSHEILGVADREGCDLIAMATHGHKGLTDLVLGSVANEVRHRTALPVLLLRGE